MEKYQYGYVKLDEVVNNPEEYIIPECLDACKMLWDKNIETQMVSNYDDEDLYILLLNESDENRNILSKLIRKDNRYFFDNKRVSYGIRVNGMDKNSKKELESLIDVFVIQDTNRFKSGEDFLYDFKYNSNKYYLDGGMIYMGLDPKYYDYTLIDALKKSNKLHLYVPEEGKVYDNEMYLEWHNRYLKYRDNCIKDKLYFITPNKTNTNPEYSKLRDFFISSERDYYEEMLGDRGEFLKELITDYNKKSPDELYLFASKIIDDFSLGLIPKRREEEMEQKILLALAGIQDVDDNNNIKFK